MLEATDLSFAYPNGTRALRNVSLTIARGERVAIVGPSGCGKSTLLRVLAGLLAPASGRATRPAGGVGMMFQEPALLPWLDVRANIALPSTLGPSAQPAAPETIDALLRLVGLWDFADARPAQLSGGMAQRAALARALLAHPEVLLLDEPFGALDALTREALSEAVAGVLSGRGTAALIVTHSIREAVFFAQRVFVMSARPGTLIEEIAVDLPEPRSWAIEAEPAFGALNARVRAALPASLAL